MINTDTKEADKPRHNYCRVLRQHHQQYTASCTNPRWLGHSQSQNTTKHRKHTSLNI